MTPDACKTQGRSSTILTYHQKDDILMLPPSAFKCSFPLFVKLKFSMHGRYIIILVIIIYTNSQTDFTFYLEHNKLCVDVWLYDYLKG